jgi:hypothetical protein
LCFCPHFLLSHSIGGVSVLCRHDHLSDVLAAHHDLGQQDSTPKVASNAGQVRAFYETAFHAAEHLAQAELLCYAPTAEIVSTSKTHQTVRSTYALWARLDNAYEQLARLPTAMEQVRQATTYLRSETRSDLNDPEWQLAVLHELLNWVLGVVEEGRDLRLCISWPSETSQQVSSSAPTTFDCTQGSAQENIRRQAGHDLLL